MSWTGALAGGALGAFLGGPLGALIGAAVGHMATGSSAEKPQRESQDFTADEKQAVFIVALFSTLAKLAKADGVVSSEEAEMIRRFIGEHFHAEQRKFIKEIFNTARDNDETFEAYFDQLNRLAGNDREFRQHFLSVLCELAMADGNLHPREREQLLYAEKEFGLPGYVNTFFNYGETAAEGSKSLAVYYEILGCTEAASDAEVKSAYRRKCRDFHPDRVQSKGLPEEFISFAEKEMQRINQAYEEIKKSRNIS